MTKYALIIPTFENNIGYKIAALNSFLKHTPKNMDIFFVYGGTNTKTREDIRSIVENEKDSIIIASYGTFSTGINIRNLHNVIFASPTKSKIRILQSLGRGLRLGDSKSKATLYDIADDFSYKEKRNFTLGHFMERINTYSEQEFDYELDHVDIR